jgi:hypothetical protein
MTKLTRIKKEYPQCLVAIQDEVFFIINPCDNQDTQTVFGNLILHHKEFLRVTNFAEFCTETTVCEHCTNNKERASKHTRRETTKITKENRGKNTNGNMRSVTT